MLDNYMNIVKQKSKRRRGRPTVVAADKAVGLRLPEDLVKRIEAWRKRHGATSISSAIRALIEQGLEDR